MADTRTMSATSYAGRALPAAVAADDGADMTYVGDTGVRRNRSSGDARLPTLCGVTCR